MGVPTDGKEGFPRLPFPKTWPDRDDLEREIDNLAKRGAPYPEALKRVLEVIGQYRVLEGQNYSFASRHWGTADVSENTSEHWNYLRNSNFNLSGSPSKYWNQGAGVTAFTQLTTGLPYGVRTGGKVTTLGANGHIQQSASAIGSTWYTVSSWIYPVAGTLLTLSVTENSGSTTARTHARAWPSAGIITLVDTWRHLPSHTQPILAWRTYKGTTRQNVKLAITGNQGQFQIAEIQLEKGRRPHPWRPHMLDWGNYITSLKTAGSASYWGNIVISASGGAIVRQYVGSNRFVYGTRYGTIIANPSTSGTVGTAKTLMRSDARVRAVRSMRTPGSASFAGSIVLSASGGAKIRQVAGPPRKFVIGAPTAPSASSAKPKPVSTSGTAGVLAPYAREDHVHRGVKALRKAGGSSADGTITLSASGTGSAVRMSGAKAIFGGPKPASATPTPVSSSGTVGTGTLWARTDHRHRGVKALRTATVSAAATVVVSASGAGSAVRISAGKLFIGPPKPATATPAAPSTSGTVGTGTLWARTDHRHRGIKSIRTPGSASFAGSIVLSASGGAKVRQVAGPPRKFVIGAPAAGGGSTNDYNVAGGRLTLTSGTPVTTSDVTAAGTLYYTPYLSDRIGTYSGTTWSVSTFTEKSLALTITSGKNYDVFIVDSTLALELSAAWTNDTTRADALTTQNGIQVKSGSTTRRYLGTIRASAANQTEDSAAKRFVWNMYHRVLRQLAAVDTTDSWTYTTNTWRQANASAANQVEIVRGLNEDAVVVHVIHSAYSSGGNNNAAGVGISSTTANSATVYGGGCLSQNRIQQHARYNGYPGIGYYYLAWLERAQAFGTVTWIGDNAADGLVQSGIEAEVFA